MQQFAERAALICLAALAFSAIAGGAAFGQTTLVIPRGGVTLDPRGPRFFSPAEATKQIQNFERACPACDAEKLIGGNFAGGSIVPAKSPMTIFGGIKANEGGTIGIKVAHGAAAPGDIGQSAPAGSIGAFISIPNADAPGTLLRIVRDDVTAPIQSDTVVPENPNAIVVAIRYMQDGKEDLCTGTLLDATHVLTAGHCGCGTSYEVVFESKEAGAPGVAIKGAPLVFDPSLCRSYRPTGNDLALLTLSEPIKCKVAAGALGQIVYRNGQFRLNNGDLPQTDCRLVSDQINTTGLLQTFGYPDKLFYNLMTKLQSARRLTAIGYGYTENRTIGVRMRADIPIRSVACTERQFASECSPFSEMILGELLGQSLRKDTCRGDSGGPVFLIENGRYTLVAVTSRATYDRPDDPELRCGGGGIYTIVARNSVISWLQANGVWQSQILPTAQASTTGQSQ